MNLFKQIITQFFKTTAVLIVLILLLTIFVHKAKPKNGEKEQQVTNLPEQQGESFDRSTLKLSQLDLNDRIVYIYGEINESNGPNIAQEILSLADSPKPMFILLNSPGGSIFYGNAIVSAIQSAKGPVNTVCVQICASMAAMIHQYGTNRYVINRSILMFHPASGGGSGGDGDVDKSVADANFIQRFIAKMEENAANRAKLTFLEYKFYSGTDLWVDSEDALNRHFADKVVFVRGSDSDKLVHFVASEKPENKKKVIPYDVNKDDTVKFVDSMWE